MLSLQNSAIRATREGGPTGVSGARVLASSGWAGGDCGDQRCSRWAERSSGRRLVERGPRGMHGAVQVPAMSRTAHGEYLLRRSSSRSLPTASVKPLSSSSSTLYTATATTGPRAPWTTLRLPLPRCRVHRRGRGLQSPPRATSQTSTGSVDRSGRNQYKTHRRLRRTRKRRNGSHRR